MFLIVAKKSRTFSCLPCSADEQVHKSWEGAQPDKQPKLVNGNIPYYRHHARYINEGWLGGRNASMSLASPRKSAVTAQGLAAQSVIGQ